MSTEVVSTLRQRMIEDMNARRLGAYSQRSHIYSCRRFAAFLKRSPDMATPDDVRRFQLHLAETGMSICNRNRIMTGVKFLFRVTLRRLDLVAEIYHLLEPQKIPLVMSPDETRRLLAVARSKSNPRTFFDLKRSPAPLPSNLTGTHDPPIPIAPVASTAASPTAISCLGAFQTPARMSACRAPSCRRPKTCTKPAVVLVSN